MQNRAVTARLAGPGGARRILIAVLGVVSVLSVFASGPAQAQQAPAKSHRATAAVTSRLSAPEARVDMSQPFARETAREGDADTSAYDIDHVTELQYRLKWAGVFHVGVTGTYGPITEAAVEKFQRRAGLKVTGVARAKTWAALLRHTVQHRKRIPETCLTKGWHACYDRSMHQVTLWHRGHLYNTWLVRGGGSSTPTRTGDTHVYYRDVDHVSHQFHSPMPYSQFFDGGEAFHGSALMVDPFVGHSHGCINMYIEDARQLWNLTADKRLNVTVYGSWD